MRVLRFSAWTLILREFLMDFSATEWWKLIFVRTCGFHLWRIKSRIRRDNASPRWLINAKNCRPRYSRTNEIFRAHNVGVSFDVAEARRKKIVGFRVDVIRTSWAHVCVRGFVYGSVYVRFSRPKAQITGPTHGRYTRLAKLSRFAAASALTQYGIQCRSRSSDRADILIASHTE